MSTDPALGFWLGWAQTHGALHEQVSDATLVVLPRPLQEALTLPEEVSLTADPEVAREDDALLLAHGHPALDHATEEVLDRGDVGHLTLARPASLPPDSAALLARAREAFPVDHGKIEVAGTPTVTHLPMLRVGALLTHSVSSEDRFQERSEVWVDAGTGLALPDEAREKLITAARSDATRRPAAALPDTAAAAVAAAHRILEDGAAVRRAALARETVDSRAEEMARTVAYFDDALASIRKRRANAAPDRRHLYDAREEATLGERARRLVEIEEKWRPRTEVRPFRLHLLWVPAMRLPAQVRRGPRSYPILLHWLLPAASFLPVPCPHCATGGAGDSGAGAGGQVLVAGKQRLGCRQCLDRPVTEAAAPLRPTPPPERAPTRPAPAPREVARRPAAAPPSRQRPVAGRTTRGPAVAQLRASRWDEKRLAAAGDKLALGFWQAVADGQSRQLRRLIAPDSPLAALVSLLGVAAPAHLLGLGPRERPESVISQPVDAGLTPPQVAWGDVATVRARHPYSLRWALVDDRPMAIELLDTPGAIGWRLPKHALLWGPRPVQQWPPPLCGLDPVAASLWRAVPAENGLPLVGRCVAAWWRARQDPRLADLAASDVAAAVHHQVGRRAGVQLTYAQVAADHGAAEPAVRSAAKALQAVLQLSEIRCW